MFWAYKLTWKLSCFQANNVGPVADLGLVAWGGGGENFKGVPKIQGGAKLTNLVN